MKMRVVTGLDVHDLAALTGLKVDKTGHSGVNLFQFSAAAPTGRNRFTVRTDIRMSEKRTDRLFDLRQQGMLHLAGYLFHA